MSEARLKDSKKPSFLAKKSLHLTFIWEVVLYGKNVCTQYTTHFSEKSMIYRFEVSRLIVVALLLAACKKDSKSVTSPPPPVKTPVFLVSASMSEDTIVPNQKIGASVFAVGRATDSLVVRNSSPTTIELSVDPPKRTPSAEGMDLAQNIHIKGKAPGVATVKFLHSADTTKVAVMKVVVYGNLAIRMSPDSSRVKVGVSSDLPVSVFSGLPSSLRTFTCQTGDPAIAIVTVSGQSCRVTGIFSKRVGTHIVPVIITAKTMAVDPGEGQRTSSVRVYVDP